MKKDWQIKKLGEVCEIARGGSPRPIKDFITTDESGVNWIKIGDTDPTGKYIFQTAEKIKPAGISKSRFVEEGDFLLSNSMSFGRPYILKTNGCIHDGWLVLKKYEQTLFIDFFYYLLLSPNVQNQFNIEAKGSTVRNLNTDIVKKIKVSIPPLEEQKRIVAVLDKKFAQIETLKTAAEKNLQNTKQLFQAELEKTLLTSQTDKVVDLFDIKTGKLNSNAAVPNGKYPFFTCSREVFSIDNYAFDCDAILLAGNNASGDFNVKHYCGKFNAYQRTYVLTVKESKIAEIKLLYYVLENYLKKLKIMSVGANTRFLKLGMIQNLDFPNYSLNEQKRIVAHLDFLSEKVHQLEEIYTKQLADCDELKQSLLQKAFEGEL